MPQQLFYFKCRSLARMKVTKTQITDAKEDQIPGSRLLEAGTTPLLRKNTAITNIRFEFRQFGDKITLFFNSWIRCRRQREKKNLMLDKKFFLSVVGQKLGFFLKKRANWMKNETWQPKKQLSFRGKFNKNFKQTRFILQAVTVCTPTVQRWK